VFRKGNGRQEVALPGTRPTEKIGTLPVDTFIVRGSLPDVVESDDYQDDIETHYASLERLRPCACYDGWVFVGYEDEYGEEREASYRCRRCNAGETS
jgi:hypothetical protein